MHISVIIPTKGRFDLLQQVTQGLPQQGPDYELAEVIVVETGDEDDEIKTVEYCLSKGYFYVPAKGASFATAVNLGMQHNNFGTGVLLLNNDIIPRGDFIQPLAKRFKQLGCTGIVGARLTYLNGLIQHAGIGLDQDMNPYNLWVNAPGDHPEVMQPRAMLAVTFACALVPSIVLKMMPLDEGLINSYEDVDLCLRARECGYSVYYEPQATAVHLEGQTEGREDKVAESWQYFRQKMD